MEKLLLFCFFFICAIKTPPLLAQSITDNIETGDQAYSDGNFYAASMHYGYAFHADTTNIELAYKYAESCRYWRDYRNAERCYEYVYKNAPPSNFPLVSFWLAQCKMANRKYLTAKKLFNSYLKLHKTDNNYFTEKAIQEVKSCEYAIVAIKDSVHVTIENMGTNINAEYSDFAPFPLGDSLLYYTGLRLDTNDQKIKKKKEMTYASKIMYSRKKDFRWQKSKEIDSKINLNKVHAGNCTFSSDGKRFYYTNCLPGKKNKISCAIYKCNVVDGKFSEPVKLNEKINMEGYTSTQPNISANENSGDILFFVSDRPGGKGGLDIWYCIISQNEQYSEPKNIGDKINTIEDEMSPFYHQKTQTLYFSSLWHKGLGGFDIFRTKGTINSWGDPENIGYPLNSSYDDMYYSINAKENAGYLTSNRPGIISLKGETCCDDIFSFRYPNKQKAKKKYKKEQTSKDILAQTSNPDVNNTTSLKNESTLNESGKKLTSATQHNNATPEPTNNNSRPQQKKEKSINTKVKTFTGNIFDETSNQPLENVEITVYDLENGILVETKTFNKSDPFEMDLEVSKKYKIKVYKPGYAPAYMEMAVNENTESPVIKTNITLNKIILPVIYYPFDKSYLTDKSSETLNNIITLLNNHPNVIIEIDSHTDSWGENSYNNNLSDLRAKSVMEYLLSNKIPKERFKVKTFGETLPIAPNTNTDGTDNPGGRQLNRRTGFKIIN